MSDEKIPLTGGVTIFNRGGSRNFIWEGGGGAAQKVVCHYGVPVRTLRARNQTHFRQGSRARLIKGPGSSGVVLMLSRAIWALFLSILIG